MTVFTDVDGNYSFVGLNAGTYTVTQIQPEAYEDGAVTGATTNIELGFGEDLVAATFAEFLIVDDLPNNGASGNPPQLPGFLPSNLAPIGNLVGNFLGSPSPIYSGVPINSNADPLSFDSGRAVTGGYAVDNGISEGTTQGVDDVGCECECDCDCATPVDPYSGSIMEMHGQQVVEGDCEVCPDTMQEEVIMDESALVDSENHDDGQSVEEEGSREIFPHCGGNKRPSFLKRIINWFRR